MGLLLSLGSMKYASMLKPRATHLLLVDDNQNGLLARKSLLEEQGFVITTATNGEEAFDVFSKGKFDLLITDFRMPKMNGIELAHIIKKRDPAQLIIMVTGFAFTIAAYDMRPVPADFILRKPFDVKQLSDALTSLFSTGKTPAPDAGIRISPSAN